MAMALEGGDDSASFPGCFLPPRKILYPLYRRLVIPAKAKNILQIHAPAFVLSTVQQSKLFLTKKLNGCSRRMLSSPVSNGSSVAMIALIRHLLVYFQFYVIKNYKFGVFRYDKFLF